MLRGIFATLVATGGVLAATHALAQTAAMHTCSIRDIPATEMRQIEAGYGSRLQAQGKAGADQWMREQATLAFRRMVARGACSPTRSAQASRPRTGRVGGPGRPGANCHMENRLVPSFDGAAMTPTLVAVCE